MRWSAAKGPSYTTFGSVEGSPPDFSEPYGHTDGFRGTVIYEPCPAKGLRKGPSEVVLAHCHMK